MLTTLTKAHETVGQHRYDSARLFAHADTTRPEKFTARDRLVHIAVLWVVLVVALASGVFPAAAQDLKIRHFGENRLKFATVEGTLLPDAEGTGIVEYKGGKEPSSQWRASFRFTGLEPTATYTVIVRGRFGEAGTPEAGAYTPLCSFETDDQGQGSCFWYFRGLARLTIVQLRDGDENGAEVLEASRGRGRGSIETEPNRFSPRG